MKRLLVPLVLLGLLVACQKSGPVDLEALEGRARGGDPQAYEQLVELLGQPHRDLDSRAYRILLEIGRPAAPHLLEAVGTADRHRREHVIALLGNLKAAEAVEPLASVLGDRSLGRRYVAAWALGEIGDPRGIPALLKALDDPDGDVRRYATRSLIKLNRAAVGPLLTYLEMASTRGAAGAVRALGDIGDPRALPALLKRADGPNREEAVLALGKLKDARAEKALIAALKADPWRVRMNAAMALGPLGTEAAVAPLEKTLEDEVRVVREWSARSLEMITGEHYTYRNADGEHVAPYNIYH